MLRNLRESEGVEDFVREGWNEGGFGEVFDCGLESL